MRIYFWSITIVHNNMLLYFVQRYSDETACKEQYREMGIKQGLTCRIIAADFPNLYHYTWSKNKISNKSIVAKAADTEAEYLAATVIVTATTKEVQGPAVNRAVLRIAPVVAVWAPVVQHTIAGVKVAGGMQFQSGVPWTCPIRPTAGWVYIVPLGVSR